MTPENFCYWLQGFIEIGNPTQLSIEQTNEIREHLKLVFNKVTPDPIFIDPKTNTATFPFDVENWENGALENIHNLKVCSNLPDNSVLYKPLCNYSC